MHYRFLVTFDKDRAADSAAAREIVSHELTESGFIGQRGRWSRGLADWFVIGGRWSGELSRHSWAKDLSARMDAAERLNGVQVVGAYYADHDTRKKQKAIERLQDEAWRREAPEEYRAIPVNRDTYKEDGYEDDAMILTQELYDLLLKPYEGQEDSEEHADLEYDPVSPDMVGTKWVVVVDYHA